MSDKRQHEKVQSRNENFADKVASKIWLEKPSEDNPYITSQAYCHGYDLFDLIRKRNFSDVFYLLFRGELPSKHESEILEALMIALINLGPRHPSTRAAMNAGIGKTNPTHILPIGIGVLGGEYLGAGNISKTMKFFSKNRKVDASKILSLLTEKLEQEGNHEKYDDICAENTPGFSKVYGGVDILTTEIAELLLEYKGAGGALKWGKQLSSLLEPHGIGWNPTGLASAIFSDLGFQPRTGACLFQLICSPGLAAHGLELANKPITAMPYVKDENYVIESQNK